VTQLHNLRLKAFMRGLPGADFRVFGAERLVFPPSGAIFYVFGAAGQPGRAYPHCFWGGYVQKWPKTHIPSLIWRRVCTGEGEIVRLIYRG